jgi:hypothetical protein
MSRSHLCVEEQCGQVTVAGVLTTPKGDEVASVVRPILTWADNALLQGTLLQDTRSYRHVASSPTTAWLNRLILLACLLAAAKLTNNCTVHTNSRPTLYLAWEQQGQEEA